MRYVFERFGVPYVVSIQCYDHAPVIAASVMPRGRSGRACDSCELLHTAGGTPAENPAAANSTSAGRMAKSDFTYYGPGDLIRNTGWKKMPGRADYHVYSRMRFPIADAPGLREVAILHAVGRLLPHRTVGRTRPQGRAISLQASTASRWSSMKSAAVNFTYPWRDNFCELRDFLVGQCPGGYGHQGEDIRPGNCVLNQ